METVAIWKDDKDTLLMSAIFLIFFLKSGLSNINNRCHNNVIMPQHLEKTTVRLRHKCLFCAIPAMYFMDIPYLVSYTTFYLFLLCECFFLCFLVFMVKKNYLDEIVGGWELCQENLKYSFFTKNDEI